MNNENIYYSLPKVTVIILNWNGKEDTLECLKSVNQIDYPNFEVIVVDNGSDDDSVSAIRAEFPSTKILETGNNLGYAEGNNVGFRQALENGADYIFVLNNDTIVDRHILTVFQKASDLCPEAGIFGAKVLHFKRPNVIQYAGAYWDDKEMDYNFVGDELEDKGQFDRVVETPFAFGCAMFISSEVLKNVGVFDPRFFLNYEESDLCSRAKRLGYHTLFVPSARVWHKAGVSFGGLATPLHTYFMTRNRLLWAERNLGIAMRISVHLAVLGKIKKCFFPQFGYYRPKDISIFKAFYWMMSEYHLELKRRFSDPRNLARLIGVKDFWLRRFGPCPDSVMALQHRSRLK